MKHQISACRSGCSESSSESMTSMTVIVCINIQVVTGVTVTVMIDRARGYVAACVADAPCGGACLATVARLVAARAH